MREIKFRAWNKKTEQYVDFEELGVGVNSLAIKYIAPSGRVLYLEHGNSIVLEQYTGLKDTNGVEIYEGDCLGGVYKDLYIGYCDKCKSFQLKAIKDDYCYSCGNDIYFSELVDEELEVIGNIHENQELLKKGEQNA